MSRDSGLTAVVAAIIDAQEAASASHVDPVVIAQQALAKLDVTQKDVACLLALRQIARNQIRRRYKDAPVGDDGDERDDGGDDEIDDASEPAEPDLFGQLQRRYPSAAKTGVYILRSAMTPEDISWNVRRLRLEGGAKVRHGDLLQAWWDQAHPES
jgi:hypothetical protein